MELRGAASGGFAADEPPSLTIDGAGVRFKQATPTTPAVIGRSVHWRCVIPPRPRYGNSDLVIVALHAEAQQATLSSPIRSQGSEQPTMEVPLDLLLDIVARLHDAATIVRCAAASRHLRRGILEPSFRRLLDLRAAASSGPPDPVVAASYEIVDHHDRSCRDNDVIETARRLRLDSSLLGSHSFMSSRFELLVLWRWLPPRAPQTGIPPRTATCASATPSPATGLSVGRDDGCYIYRCAFLAIDVADASFVLLVMDVKLRPRTFWLEDGEWGPLRRLSSPSHAAVVGDTVHWLCIKTDFGRFPSLRSPFHSTRQNRLVILALEADAVDTAEVIELPQACLESFGRRITTSSPD
ncbi:hypothetical protein SETIT_9G070100v2 [Setaria italica]|uniref:DUF7595 domain-containing protein n=1 Tax=Setaria italica TaxID=4555 RepID=A0A368SE46_SETIT|nr:hypothetical protein SETIT_9G070100v2 [Setaria italica]